MERLRRFRIKKKIFWVASVLVIISACKGQEFGTDGVGNQDNEEGNTEDIFSPTLTATCQLNRNRMIVTLTTVHPFHGVMVAANQRNNSNCFTEGSGKTETILVLNMIASINDPDYCGVSVNYRTKEKTAQISVRQNRILELADDKNYLVSCSRFDSAPPRIAKPAHMALYNAENKEALEVVRNHLYKLKVRTSKDFKNFRIRNCFAFSGGSDQQQVPLIDQNGCPESKIISRWSFAENAAEATIYSMFRFQDSRTVTIQCHVLFCADEGDCPNPTCSETQAYSFIQTSKPDYLIGSNDTDAVVSTTVQVLEAGEKLEPLTLTRPGDPLFGDDGVCTGRFCPAWLLWLAIALGVLFLLMLLINLFLCTALTCTCTRTELIEKEPSIIEDYDPYNRSGYFDTGSQYNSRYSGMNKAYSDMSDHYATPGGTHHTRTTNEISRPNSRFSK